MGNTNIGHVLKYYRKLRKLSVANVSDSQIHLTSHEESLIRQYRKHPELQSAIDKILDIK